jgi:3-hydroxyacyl-[acyl-carrier-protein] dehydratase
MTAKMTEVVQLDIHGILKLLPHRYPFLMVDRVLECHAGQSMPGVMIIEALAQTAGILAFVTSGVVPDADTKFYFVGIDKARFRKPVEPGDQLILSVQLTRSFKGIWRFASTASVGSSEVASADMMVAPEVSK